MREDNKNLLIAIVLSVAVLIGWQYFFTPVKPPAPPAQTAQTQTSPAAPSPSQAGGPAAPGAVPAPAAPAGPAVESRETALARSPRVTIDTPSLKGSLSLRGARIDDIALKNYRETVDPTSPNIVLFSPPGTANPYYAEFRWLGEGSVALPGPDTLWTADRTALTTGAPVTLTYDNGQGLVFRLVVSVDDKFMFTVKDSVENRGGQPVSVSSYGLVTRHGKPTTLGYYALHEGMIGVLGGSQTLPSEYTYDQIAKEPAIAGGHGKTWDNVTGGFVGITDKYWASAVIPDQSRAYDGSFLERDQNGAKTYQAVALQRPSAVAPGTTAGSTQHLFAGAKEVKVVDRYATEYHIVKFDKLIDWGWFFFITQPLFRVLDFFYNLFGNFGVSILIVTVMLKILFFPLASKSYTSMAKMKAVQPEMVAIRERYADDKARQQQALMELYKKERINPVAGCWPVLIQVPVFFALYKVLFVTIEMRHAPFFGWIHDLAAPDPTSVFNLFGLLPFNPGGVPVIGHFLLLGAWPLIMGVTMWLQMKMNPEPADPVQKQVFSWMPIIFTFMLGSFPAGLVIYWAWNNFLSISQQYFIMKKNGVKVELWDNLRGTFARKAPAKT